MPDRNNLVPQQKRNIPSSWSSMHSFTINEISARDRQSLECEKLDETKKNVLWGNSPAILSRRHQNIGWFKARDRENCRVRGIPVHHMPTAPLTGPGNALFAHRKRQLSVRFREIRRVLSARKCDLAANDSFQVRRQRCGAKITRFGSVPTLGVSRAGGYLERKNRAKKSALVSAVSD